MPRHDHVDSTDLQMQSHLRWAVRRRCCPPALPNHTQSIGGLYRGADWRLSDGAWWDIPILTLHPSNETVNLHLVVHRQYSRDRFDLIRLSYSVLRANQTFSVFRRLLYSGSYSKSLMLCQLRLGLHYQRLCWLLQQMNQSWHSGVEKPRRIYHKHINTHIMTKIYSILPYKDVRVVRTLPVHIPSTQPLRLSCPPSRRYHRFRSPVMQTTVVNIIQLSELVYIAICSIEGYEAVLWFSQGIPDLPYCPAPRSLV